jgi:hypothetical protein
MPICPNKNLDSWKKLVEDLKARLPKASADDIDAYAHLAFFRKGTGDIPTIDDTVELVFKPSTKQLKADAKEAFKAFKTGKRVGEKEGFLAGQMRQGREMAPKIRKFEELAEMQKEFSGKVSQYLKDRNNVRGVIGDAQINAIVRRANKIGASEKSFKKFTEYFDKVIDDANYSANVEDAKKLQKKLTNPFADAAPLISKMRRISPEDLTAEQVIKFNKIAQDFVDSKKPVGSAGYKPFDVKLAESEFTPIENSIKSKVISDVEEAYGVLGINEEEASIIDDFLSSENMDKFYQNLEDSKKVLLRDRMIEVADYSQLGLKEKLAVDKGLLEENYGKSDVRKLELISKFDLGRIENVKQIAEITRFIDNVIVNNSFADLTSAYDIIDANADAPYLLNLTKKARLFKVGGVEKMAYDQPIILKRIFGLKEISGPFRNRVGIDDVSLAESIKEEEIVKIKKSWDTFKKNNKISNSAESDIAVGVYADLINVDPTNIDGSFNDIKKQMELSIERYKKSDNEEDVFMGDFMSTIYDYAVKDSKTREEFISKFKEAYPKEASLAEFAIEISNRYLDKLKRHAEQDLNQYFKERLDYATGRKYKSLVPDTKAVDDFLKTTIERDIRSPQETGATKERELKDSLPENKAVDYRFEYNFFKNLEKQIFVTESYAAARKFKYLSELDEFAEIVGGESNKKVLVDAFWDRYGMLAFGGKRADELANSLLIQGARISKNISSAYALGRITQVINQVAPIFNTMFQAPKYTLDVLRTPLTKDLELLKFRSIRSRGLQKGAIGRVEGTNTFVYTKGKRGAAKIFNNWYELTSKARDKVFTALIAADAFTARESFLAYYLKYMNEVAKIPTTAKDLNTEHLRINDTRLDALSYAQQAVEETQAASDRSLLSRIKANYKGDSTQELLMGIILPFNNFSSNAKARMIEDIRKIAYGNNQQKAESSIDLVGSVAETAAYQAANIFVISGVIRYGLMSTIAPIFGFENRKEFGEYMSGKVKAWYTNIMREIFASGFSQSAEDALVDLVNETVYRVKKLFDKEFDKDYYTWLKEEATFKVPYKPKDEPGVSVIGFLNGLGSYGIAPKAAVEAIGSAKSAITGRTTLEKGYIKEVEVPVELTESQRWFFVMSALLKGTALITGYSDADIIRATDAIERDQEALMKESLKTKKGGSGMRRGKIKSSSSGGSRLKSGGL